jgi:hypothetical protein
VYHLLHVACYNMFRPTLAIFRYITRIPSVFLLKLQRIRCNQLREINDTRTHSCVDGYYFLLIVIAQQDASHSPKDL